MEEVGSTMINVQEQLCHVLHYTRADLVGLEAIPQRVSKMYCDCFTSISFGHMHDFVSKLSYDSLLLAYYKLN